MASNFTKPSECSAIRIRWRMDMQRPRRAGLAVVWSSYNAIKWNRTCCTIARTRAPPMTSFGCRKGGASVMHGRRWCRQTCEPSEWVSSEECLCFAMRDVVEAGACVLDCFSRALFEARPTYASRLACVYIYPAKIGEFCGIYCESLARLLLLAVAHFACLKRGRCSIRCSLPASPTHEEIKSHVVIVASTHDMPRSASAVNIRNS